ncbi:hypothetical protein [Maridesulfovibrio sp.]|uniref:hypothetical protein n=1 Tax=Maridesulfovibrio sp. TaxID=2795000 RepID=UPI0029C9E3A6|nr:hypothetical protein [Maridesulfovibrio sp.]
MRKILLLVMVGCLVGGCAAKKMQYDEGKENPYGVKFSYNHPDSRNNNLTYAKNVVYVTFAKPIPEDVYRKILFQMRNNDYDIAVKNEKYLAFKKNKYASATVIRKETVSSILGILFNAALGYATSGSARNVEFTP